MYILRRVSDADAEALGYEPRLARPEDSVVCVLTVPPVPMRPPREGGNGAGSDVTSLYMDVLRANQSVIKAILKYGVQPDAEFNPFEA